MFDFNSDAQIPAGKRLGRLALGLRKVAPRRGGVTFRSQTGNLEMKIGRRARKGLYATQRSTLLQTHNTVRPSSINNTLAVSLRRREKANDRQAMRE